MKRTRISAEGGSYLPPEDKPFLMRFSFHSVSNKREIQFLQNVFVACFSYSAKHFTFHLLIFGHAAAVRVVVHGFARIITVCLENEMKKLSILMFARSVGSLTLNRIRVW